MRCACIGDADAASTGNATRAAREAWNNRNPTGIASASAAPDHPAPRPVNSGHKVTTQASATAPVGIGRPTDQSRLVAALANPAVFGPACTRVIVLETHISYVLLTGQHAYKLKKAVDLGFLDFTTLAARRFFCEQELRLNRRLAPSLYLDVVAFTGSIDAPAIDGGGPVLEYAVKMREFAQEALASRVLARNELGAGQIDELAAKVAGFHAASDRAPPDTKFGTPEAILRVALANFTQIRALLTDPATQRECDALATWAEREHGARAASFLERRQRGFIRECHGDLHLNNIAVVDGEVTIFDCIEFNDAMRWIDVMSEVAFTVMDLQERGRADLARRFLNAYLEVTGDYAGLSVLRFYLGYRAMVRAKVASLRASQMGSGDERTQLIAERVGYLRLAQSYARPPRPAIVITHGLAGCGKTTLSQALLERLDAVRVRTDVERKRLHGFAAAARSGSGLSSGLYTADATRRTYEHARACARTVVDAGFVAIVDGTFLQRWQRDLFRDLARELGIPFVVLAFSANATTLRERLVERERRGNDASEADPAVLEHQLRTRQALSSDEQADTVTYDAEAPLDFARSPDAWRDVLARLGNVEATLNLATTSDSALDTPVAFPFGAER